MSRGELIAQQRWLEALYLRQHIAGSREATERACAEAVSSLCLYLARQDLGLEPIPDPKPGPALFAKELPPEPVQE